MREMIQKGDADKNRHRWIWPTVGALVMIGLASIQIIRVNRPKDAGPSEPPRIYTAAGSLIDGQLTIPAKEFYSSRIDLNRRSRLFGSFRTPNIRSKVSVLVMSEGQFESWKMGTEYTALSQTGFVPGGKINLKLDEGVYVLIVDNRQNDADQPVWVDFSLER